ncbi:MAG: IS200/IS605 family transposase [Halomonas sp.]|nr:IS200/IS605 family transposase [Halomonas sp.]MDP3535956.1 IS200/IS605 family transposase [Halomonas sp.]
MEVRIHAWYAIAVYPYGVNIMKSHYYCAYDMKDHLVLVTKYRRKCFTAEMLKRLEAIARELCLKWEVELLEFDGEADHVHLLLGLNPTIQPSKLVYSLKTVTSRLLRAEFAEYLTQFYWKPVLWSRAYCMLTAGGAHIEVLRDYAIHLHPNRKLWMENFALIVKRCKQCQIPLPGKPAVCRYHLSSFALQRGV